VAVRGLVVAGEVEAERAEQFAGDDVTRMFRYVDQEHYAGPAKAAR